jgi:hypothetical protein
MAWLEDMARVGVARDVGGYLVDGGAGAGVSEIDKIGDGEVQLEPEVDGDLLGGPHVKGKGKEKEIGIKMVDITNSE